MRTLLALFVLGQLPLIPGLSLREQASFLLLEPSIQKSLALTPPQTADVETAVQAHDRRHAALVDGRKYSGDPAYVENDRRFATEAVASLNDAQRRKLFVRTVKERGVAAMADPEVAKEVGLAGAELPRVQKAADNMDARDARLSDDFVAALGKIPSTHPPTPAYSAKVKALSDANAVKEKARAVERKKEEAALLASLPQPVRLAWKKMVG